jgi:prolyl-tRNA editing enzyme YbaK/EbsC (Cys-tRNA(Pro) deacylase)
MNDGHTEPVARVAAALRRAGHPDAILAFGEGTHTAADAAAAIGCTLAQIAKTVVFRARRPEGSDVPVLIIISGSERVDRAKAEAALGSPLKRADPAWVADASGFAVGGVSPVGVVGPALFVIDDGLLSIDPIWVAAGSANHVFRTDVGWLRRLTGGIVADVRAPVQ